MLINKIAEKIHLKSKTGRLIFGSILTGLLLFLLLFIGSFSLKIASISTCLIGSAICAVVCSVFYFIKSLVSQ